MQWQQRKRVWLINKGFSLIEVLIVVALLSIISALSFNFYTINKASFVKADLDKLYSTCLYARQKAQLTKSLYSLEFSIKYSAYTLYRHSNIYKNNKNKTKILEYSLANTTVFGALPSVMGPPGNPSSYIHDSITFRDHVIFFYPDGTLSAGVVYLSDTARRYTYALTSSVSQVSYIRRYIYSFNTCSWSII